MYTVFLGEESSEPRSFLNTLTIEENDCDAF